ncbi:MAG: hypothetical protein EOM23_08265, partial [Candidatus Moranbacteria bacterium]|nr:hypothetical protein [Candidatus Moranbacteria bacterium]
MINKFYFRNYNNKFTLHNSNNINNNLSNFYYEKLTCLLLTLAVLSPAIAQGWRPGEKEIRVEINTVKEAAALYELNLNGDFYGDHALLYVTPQEIELVINSGFDYKILIEDLNDHYKDFWQTRDAYHSYAEIIALADSLAEHFPY